MSSGSTTWTVWEFQRSCLLHFLESSTQKHVGFDWCCFLSGCLIPFSPERHILPSWAGSVFGSSIEIIKPYSQIGIIFLKYHCCWKWRRREKGTPLNSKNFLRCVVALDFQPLLASGVNLDLALEDEQILKYRQICQKFEDKSLAASNRMWMDCLLAFQSMEPISKPHFDSPADTRSDHPTFWETNDAAVSKHQSHQWRMYVYSDVIF